LSGSASNVKVTVWSTIY